MRLFDHDGNVSYSCGYCQRDVTVPVLWRSLEQSNGATVAICSNCRRATVFDLGPSLGPAQLIRPDGANDTYRDVVLQLPGAAVREYHADVVPEPIARRYRDVQRAMQRELWEQAISTSRTAVQVMARLEEVERGNLYQEIERLMDKRGAELPELVKAMAHRIRDAGNDALHPDDPDWSPSQEEAREAFALLQATIEWLYVMPARLKRVEAAVESAGQESVVEDESSD